MSMYEKNDIIEQKKKEKRKKNIIRIFIIIIIAAVAVVAFVTRESWVDKLRGIGKQYTTIINDHPLAEGNFPIEINENADYQVCYADGIVALISDAYIYYYNKDGELINRRQHAYTNAVMRNVDDKLLIYESGGSRFRVEEKNNVMYEKQLEQNIIFARISKEGYTAVVTSSVNYECEVVVYDRRGELIYHRKCIQRVNDICFTANSQGCIISYIYAQNGSLVTSVQEAVFTDRVEKWNSPALDMFGMDVYNSDDSVFVLGFEACGYVDKTGQIISFYKYDGDFAGGSSSNGQSAVIINSDDRRKYIMALFNGGGEEPLIISFKSPLIDVVVDNGLAYVMTQDSVLAYEFDGNLHSTASISDSYTGFVRSKDYVFLKSFSKIDRMDYES